jgi:hypothetical protein
MRGKVLDEVARTQFLRENMSGLSEAEIERAIEDLDRRDARKQDQ